MLRFVFSTILVAAFAVLHTNTAAAASVDGEHPYDTRRTQFEQREKVIRYYRSLGYGNLWFYQSSRYNTTTHMLHPYFRSHPYRRYQHADERHFQRYEDLRVLNY